MDFAEAMSRQWERDTERAIDEMSGDGPVYKEREYSNDDVRDLEDERMRDWE